MESLGSATGAELPLPTEKEDDTGTASLAPEQIAAASPLVPLNRRIVILQLDSDEKIGGIFIPETSRGEKPQEGIVMEMSSDCKMDIKPKDLVVFSKYSGSIINVDRQNYLIIHEEDVIAKRKPRK